MRRIALTLLLFAVAVGGYMAAATEEPVSAAGHEWITDYKAGLEKAKAEDKPIFLEFRCVP